MLTCCQGPVVLGRCRAETVPAAAAAAAFYVSRMEEVGSCWKIWAGARVGGGSHSHVAGGGGVGGLGPQPWGSHDPRQPESLLQGAGPVLAPGGCPGPGENPGRGGGSVCCSLSPPALAWGYRWRGRTGWD